LRIPLLHILCKPAASSCPPTHTEKIEGQENKGDWD
jgi:hypothetical protein